MTVDDKKAIIAYRLQKAGQVITVSAITFPFIARYSSSGIWASRFEKARLQDSSTHRRIAQTTLRDAARGDNAEGSLNYDKGCTREDGTTFVYLWLSWMLFSLQRGTSLFSDAKKAFLARNHRVSYR